MTRSEKLAELLAEFEAEGNEAAVAHMRGVIEADGGGEGNGPPGGG